MKLNEQFEIQIPDEKLVNYLLSPAHRIGNHKAEFFERYGYNRKNWKELKTRIIELAENNDARLQKENQFGRFFRVEGAIKAISGEMINLRTAWIVVPESKIARLVTAYPI